MTDEFIPMGNDDPPQEPLCRAHIAWAYVHPETGHMFLTMRLKKHDVEAEYANKQAKLKGYVLRRVMVIT